MSVSHCPVNRERLEGGFLGRGHAVVRGVEEVGPEGVSTSDTTVRVRIVRFDRQGLGKALDTFI